MLGPNRRVTTPRALTAETRLTVRRKTPSHPHGMRKRIQENPAGHNQDGVWGRNIGSERVVPSGSPAPSAAPPTPMVEIGSSSRALTTGQVVTQPRQPLKVIFLDIDGVICCNMRSYLEDQKLDTLARVIDATGAKIVLSTDWRRQRFARDFLLKVLRGRGFQVIGQTPMGYPFARPKEINGFLENHARNVNMGKKPPIDQFVAIDDRPLLSEGGGNILKGHFVQTVPRHGLTEEKAQQLISILNSSTAVAARPPSSGRL